MVIDAETDSPLEAAREAQSIMREAADPEFIGNCFYVLPIQDVSLKFEQAQFFDLDVLDDKV